MRDFRFYQQGNSEADDIESIIRQRKRKIARQQLLYSIILLFIIVIICVWLYRKTVYVEFDGYVSLDINTTRTEEDIYFLKANVRVGDLVIPGDTLFSYVIAHNFFDHTRNDYEPAILSRNRDMKVQYGLARQDLEVLRVRISELERQLSTEDHNIRLGLSDNHNKLRTEQELAEAREQYKALRRKIGVLWNAVSQTEKSVSRLNNNGYGYVDISDMYNLKLMERLGLVRYSVAVDSSIVIKKYVSSNSLVLRGEDIMSLQSLNALDNNLTIVGYVMPDEMQYVNYHSKAEVIVGNDITYSATVMMLGSRTEEIPGELRNTLSRDYTASIVVFDIEPNQDIPYWSLTDGVPVRIRINKFKNRTPIKGDYIIYNTTTGVDPETLSHARHQCLRNQALMKSKHIAVPDVRPAAADSTVARNQTSAAPSSARTGNSESSGHYCIVVASGHKEDGARRYVADLKKRGYKNAGVSVAEGKYRVYIDTFATGEDADRALEKLKKQAEFRSAWVLH